MTIEAIVSELVKISERSLFSPADFQKAHDSIKKVKNLIPLGESLPIEAIHALNYVSMSLREKAVFLFNEANVGAASSSPLMMFETWELISEIAPESKSVNDNYFRSLISFFEEGESFISKRQSRFKNRKCLKQSIFELALMAVKHNGNELSYNDTTLNKRKFEFFLKAFKISEGNQTDWKKAVAKYPLLPLASMSSKLGWQLSESELFAVFWNFTQNLPNGRSYIENSASVFCEVMSKSPFFINSIRPMKKPDKAISDFLFPKNSHKRGTALVIAEIVIDSPILKKAALSKRLELNCVPISNERTEQRRKTKI